MHDISKKITFIIPCFNSEKQIIDCIDSILKYIPFANIIIVDDGSIDNTYMVCKENYLSKNKNIKIFKNSNHGVSYTRNFAINKCNTEYLFFVDSDDFIISNEIIDVLKNYDESIDIMKFSFNIINGRKQKKVIFQDKIINMDNQPIKRKFNNLFFESADYNMVWGQIIKKSIICNNGIYFDEKLAFAEDIDFNFRLYNFCHKIHLSNIIAYNYNNNCGITKKFGYIYLNKRINDILYSFKKFLKYETVDKQVINNKFFYEIFPQLMRISEDLSMEKWINYICNIKDGNEFKEIISDFNIEKYHGKYKKIINYFLNGNLKIMYLYSKYIYCKLKEIQGLKNKLGW